MTDFAENVTSVLIVHFSILNINIWEKMVVHNYIKLYIIIYVNYNVNFVYLYNHMFNHI